MANPPIVAWTVKDWGSRTSLSKSYIYVLISKGIITSVKSGRKRLITNAPETYLDKLAA